MRTVKSAGLPEIMIVIARSAATIPRKKPPFFACSTTPWSLPGEVWVVNPSDFRYSSMWDCRELKSVPFPWKCSTFSPIITTSRGSVAG